ncbi:oxidoreductase domain protein [Pseudopedobacter saltans DSM 12145]|uniref:Oxidoreductase domain protein n=1 Tax=Pseudopedobacter saltans (strain ATCC 51119 / DSM 12145 / JCM 21818 / CCUG 39354 / LMG 10337 / NBRC 100064 / NCIMB 13643) TaxID=762903 RepID=F0S810_PSESL|nr:Gfo/Idh/MocA family oxidoreductase [Pseudopedobacter saltans]ADY51231.1 oxidoreductase domain protein [Pseudopedobacter saltans DSM 12145]
MENSRRKFIKQSAIASAGVYLGTMGMSAKSYGRIIGANDRVRIGVVGFSDRFRSSLFPSFLNHYKELNFEIVAVSDLWKLRREEGKGFLEQKLGNKIQAFRNNDELYTMKDLNGVIISTADFQHALHTIEAVKAGCDAYVEKPFAETMEDNKAALKAVRATDRIVQIGSQRRSGLNYKAAEQFIKEGKFGNITMVELTWNVNQPGRWRRPELVAKCKEADTDWKRFLMNRPYEAWDPRKYLEYRLFWPYSSGMPGQWMSHQIDTVHWFTNLKHPRSVVANGGVYQWKDGRRNWDTTTAVFDYGPENDMNSGFQVTFNSRMHNGDERPSEVYYSNGGELNLITNKVSPKGGLTEKAAEVMGMKANLLPEVNLTEKVERVAASANTGADVLTSAHMRNWMECIRSRKQPNAPVEAGYYHSIANIMTTAASHTGAKATFDSKAQEVMANGKIFKI